MKSIRIIKPTGRTTGLKKAIIKIKRKMFLGAKGFDIN